MTELDRFMSKVDPGPGCWLWTAGATAAGYGVFWVSGRPVLAHRASHQLHLGPIPEGLQIDHLCRVRRCVNPAHLEAVTQAENIRRGESASALNGAKTHCPTGHPYDGANTYVTPAGHRQCRACALARRLARKAAA